MPARWAITCRQLFLAALGLNADLAEGLLDRAVVLDPDFALAYAHGALRFARRYEAAVALTERVMELAPNKRAPLCAMPHSQGNR